MKPKPLTDKIKQEIKYSFELTRIYPTVLYELRTEVLEDIRFLIDVELYERDDRGKLQ